MFEPNVPKEIQRIVFELTLALYRVTDFFPQGEVLRKHLRDKANEIFGGISEFGFSEDFGREAMVIMAKIQAIKGYLGIARYARFVRPINLSVLEREYEFLADFFSREIKRPETTKPSVQKEKIADTKEDLATWNEFAAKKEEKSADFERISEAISERQQKILEHIRQSERAKISDFIPHFVGISSKTIQRDLQDMVTKNLLKKDGEKRWTVYSLNGHA